ncbi:MAG: VOC family protein [Alphaproteobacteria bacterium]|nr:VOC family protein [Alphaproteobacteria bacterium]
MRIDHLVWYGADLAASRDDFTGKLDTAPAYGGEHPGEGTANYLASLGAATYLEILGRDPGQSAASLAAEIAALKGHGLYHWAVGGIAIADLAARAEAVGLAHGIAAGGRTKPDGTKLAWTCLGIHGHGFGALVPFFIDWHETPHPARSAPRGGALAELRIETPSPVGLQHIFDALGIDLTVSEGAEARLVARLETNRGAIELKSFAPVPRGYTI